MSSASLLIDDFRPGELIYDKAKYRVKFDVHFAEWNPAMDLLALASTKGNVVVKRLQWKTGWKVDFGKQNFLSGWRKLISTSSSLRPFTIFSETEKQRTPAVENSTLDGICWSPDGQVLVVAFGNGHLYFLDAQCGRPLFYVELDYAPTRLSWFLAAAADSISCDDCPTIMLSHTDFQFLEGAPSDCASLVADLEAFAGRLLDTSLLGTLLCLSHVDDATENVLMDVLMCGFLNVKRFNLSEALKSVYVGREDEVFPSTLEVLNMSVDRKENMLRVVCKYCAKKDPTPFPLTDESESESPFGYKTSVLELPFDFSEQQIKLFAEAAHLVGQMSICIAYISEIFASCTFDWVSESEAFHRRLLFNMRSTTSIQDQANFVDISESEMFSLCRDFLTVITTGILPKSVQNFFVHDSALKDLKLANGFVDTNFSALIVGISLSLQPAIQLFKQYLRSLSDVLDKILEIDSESDFFSESCISADCEEMEVQEDNSRTTQFCSIHSSVHFFEEFQRTLTELDESFCHLLTVAEENRRNLKYFVRFLLTLCISQNEELSEEELSKAFEIHKVNLRSLCNFISEKFGNFNDVKNEQNNVIGDVNNSALDEAFNYEFGFLESYSKRLQSPIHNTAERSLSATRSIKFLLDDVLAVLNDFSTKLNPIETLNNCASLFNRLLCEGIEKFLC